MVVRRPLRVISCHVGWDELKGRKSLFGGNATTSLGCRAHFNLLLCSNWLQVNLRLILVSGKTQDFIFSPNDSATDIARHVFENWPAGMFYWLYWYISEIKLLYILATPSLVILKQNNYRMSLFISEVNVMTCFRLGGRECEQPKHPEADLPGSLPAWQRHTRRYS